MRTIDNILEYHLLDHEKTCLYQCGIINGIWGQGKNIEAILLANIELLPWFDQNKSEALLEDIRAIADEHDIDYRLQLWFYKANYKFAKKLFFLLHWSGIKRFAIATIALILLNKHWKVFYK